MERDHQKNMERALARALGEHRKNKWDMMEDICELIVYSQSLFSQCLLAVAFLLNPERFQGAWLYNINLYMQPFLNIVTIGIKFKHEFWRTQHPNHSRFSFLKK